MCDKRFFDSQTFGFVLPFVLVTVELGSKSRNRLAVCFDYVRHGYSFMPANAALRCQSNKADLSSWAADDGVVGADL